MRYSIFKLKQQLHLLCYLHKPDYKNFPVYIPIVGSLSKKTIVVQGQLHMLPLLSSHIGASTWSIYAHHMKAVHSSKCEYLTTQLHILQILMLYALRTSSLNQIDQTIFLKSDYRSIFHVEIQLNTFLYLMFRKLPHRDMKR